MIRGYNESTLAQSEVWRGLDENLKVREKCVFLINNSKHLTKEDVEVAYVQCKQLTDSMTVEALRAFDNEEIELIYARTAGDEINQAIPFITFGRKSGGYTGYVFVNKYCRVSEDKGITMLPAHLRDLLTGAMMSNSIRRNYPALASNQYLEKICMEMYTEFFMRIINREYAISADKATFDTIKYFVSRFFLEHVFGAMDSTDAIDVLAKSQVKYLDDIAASNLRKNYEEASVTGVSDLLKLISTLSPRMASCALGRFMNDWIQLYYVPAMLAIDNIEYFIFMCLTLLSGNNIINTAAADVVKENKGIKSFRAELMKVCKREE